MLEEPPRRFPSFSHEAVILATGCTDNALSPAKGKRGSVFTGKTVSRQPGPPVR